MILPYFHRWIIACRLTINIRGRDENPQKGLKTGGWNGEGGMGNFLNSEVGIRKSGYHFA
jgi:hypothetical protein